MQSRCGDSGTSHGNVSEVVAMTTEEIKAMMLRHAQMMIDAKGEFTGIHEMRKHVAWYTQGLKDSAKLRAQINQVESFDEMKALLDKLI